jgi:predicted metalloprotease
MYCPLDDTISWDTDLLAMYGWSVGAFGPGFVLAHEWGHLNQARSGLLVERMSGRRYTLQDELHADCQAGVFAAIEESLGTGSVVNVLEALPVLFENSDNTPWLDPNGHGNFEARKSAYARGYLTARAQIERFCDSEPLPIALEICGVF